MVMAMVTVMVVNMVMAMVMDMAMDMPGMATVTRILNPKRNRGLGES